MKEYINELIEDIEYKIEKLELYIEDHEDNCYFQRELIICKDKIKILNKVRDYLIKLFEEQ